MKKKIDTNEAKNSTEGINVGVVSRARRIQLSRSTVAMFLVAILLSVLCVGFIRYNSGQQIAISVGGYKLRVSEYKKLLMEAGQIGVAEPAAKQEIIEGLAARAAADKLGIDYDVDPAIIGQLAASKYASDNDSDQNNEVTEYQKITVYKQHISNVIEAEKGGGKKVAYFEYPFGRYIVGFANTESGDPNLFRDIPSIRNDMAFAKEKSESDKKLLSEKKRTYQQVISSIKAEKRLTLGQISNKTTLFVVDKNGEKQSYTQLADVADPAFIKDIIPAKSGQITDIRTKYFSDDDGQIDMPDIRNQDGIAVAYYFGYVVADLQARPNLLSDFQSAQKEFIK